MNGKRQRRGGLRGEWDDSDDEKRHVFMKRGTFLFFCYIYNRDHHGREIITHFVGRPNRLRTRRCYIYNTSDQSDGKINEEM